MPQEPASSSGQSSWPRASSFCSVWSSLSFFFFLPHFLGFPSSHPLGLSVHGQDHLSETHAESTDPKPQSVLSVSAFPYAGLGGYFPPCMVLTIAATILPSRIWVRFCPERELATGIRSFQGNRGTSASPRRIQLAQGSGRLCTPSLLSPGRFWWIQTPVRMCSKMGKCQSVLQAHELTVSGGLGSTSPGLLPLLLLEEGVAPAPLKGV